MLIVGCDIGSEIHYVRAIDVRGRELSEEVFGFSNNEEGFESAKAWMLNLAANNDKEQIVLGLEPTLLVCINRMAGLKRNQRGSGKSICCKAEQRD